MSLLGCSSISRNVSNLLFPPWPSSDQRKDESTSITLKYKKDPGTFLCETIITTKPEEARFAPIGAQAAAELIVKQLENFLEEEVKRYTAAYSATKIGDQFWACQATKTEGKNKAVVNLDTIEIKRTVKKGTFSNGEALDVKFKVIPTRDQTAIALFPYHLKLTRAKAKVALFDISKPFGFDILAPWTVLQLNDASDLLPVRPAKVDMKFDLAISGVWLENSKNESWKWHNEKVASQIFSVPAVPIGGDLMCDISNVKPDIVEFQNLYAENEQCKKFPIDSILLAPIPRSTVPFFDNSGSITTNYSGLGNFIVSALITEYDDFGERVTQINKTVKDNESGLVKGLSNLLE